MLLGLSSAVPLRTPDFQFPMHPGTLEFHARFSGPAWARQPSSAPAFLRFCITRGRHSRRSDVAGHGFFPSRAKTKAGCGDWESLNAWQTSAQYRARAGWGGKPAPRSAGRIVAAQEPTPHAKCKKGRRQLRPPPQ